MKTTLLFAVSCLLMSLNISAQYCTPTYSSACTSGDYIENFSTTGAATTDITNNLSGCNGQTNNFIYYSGTYVDEYPGQSVDISIQAGASWGQGHRIWVDWNQDGDFLDANEDCWNSGTSGTNVFTGTINVPPTAIPGTTRMRVKCEYATVPTDPCASVTFGECEDYDFVVLSPAAEDAGVAMIDSPAVPACNLGNDVWVTIRNYGTNTLTSTTIAWEVNGVPQGSFNWTGSLVTLATDQVNIGTYAFTNGDNLKVWTEDPNGVTESGVSTGNDTTTQAVSVGLSGSYFITPSGLGDYLSFTEAVNDLNAFGVCGSVTFLVEAGTYTEQITIPEIVGASATNTIRFTSLTGDPNSVTLAYGPTGTSDNFTVAMDGGKFITFEKLTIATTGTTYGRVFDFLGDANYNTVDSCNIFGVASASSTSTNIAVIYSGAGTLDSMNTFIDNSVSGGSYATYWYGGNTTTQEVGNSFVNNDFSDYYYRGAHLYYQLDMEVAYNVSSPSTAYTGSIYRYYLYYCDGALDFHHNKASRDSYGYGAYFSNCKANATAPAYIHNNSFSVGNPASTSTSYGMYFTSCNYLIVHSNSVNISSNGTTSRCFYFTGGLNNELYSNNAMNDGPGYGVYVASGLIGSDYNNFYVPNGNYGYLGGAQATITDWQNASGWDMMSFNVNPNFPSFEDLTTCNDTLDGTGRPDSTITVDFNDDPRAAMPDVGAFEFDGISSFSIGSDTTICSTASVTLGNAASNSTWSWNTGDNTNTITASAAGTYYADITSVCGTASDTVVITHLPDPVADFSFSTSFLTGVFTNTSTDAYSWSWDFGDGATSTDENPAHVYASGGSYVVTLTVTGECGTDIYTDTVEVGVTSIEEGKGIAFELYPNPADNTTTLSSAVILDNAQVTVMDASGRTVRAFNVSGNTIDIDVQGLAKGQYFIRVQNNNSVGHQKLLIQ